MILSGGPCEDPIFKEYLSKAFPDINIRCEEPETAVVRGTSIYGYNLKNVKPNYDV